MKKGYTLVEVIISISLVAVISTLTLVLFKNIKPTYADVYESLRQTIADSTKVYLNINAGSELKNRLMNEGSVELNTNDLIGEGLLDESYYVTALDEDVDVKNIPINVSIDDEGLFVYDINLQ